MSAARAHAIVSIRLSFRYVAGYTPRAITTKKGATVSVVLIDVANHSDVATLYTSAELTAYSFDNFKGYSPPLVVRADGVQVPNGRALFVALRFHNSERNLQLPLDPSTGMGVHVEWSPSATDTAVPPPRTGEPTNAACYCAARPTSLLALPRGALHGRGAHVGAIQQHRCRPGYGHDVECGDRRRPGRAALRAARRARRAAPFNVSHFPSVIHAKARTVAAWKSRRSAADEPPPSPLQASQLGLGTDVLLVPYGASNLRMAGLPWF